MILIIAMVLTTLHIGVSAENVKFADDTEVGLMSTEYTCGSLTYEVNYDNTVTVTDFDESVTSVDIPSQIDGKNVTSIGDYAFTACSNLTAITIPDSVTNIGDGAFESCSNLTAITIPDSVTNIGDKAFSFCYSLTSINVNISNKNYCSVEGNLFDKNRTVLIQYAIGKKNTEFTIPDSVTSIGDYAFQGCRGLTSVTIPDSVTTIGDGTFWNCRSLTSVTIPDSVTTIGVHAFEWCSGLKSVIIPNSVTSIGGCAFYECRNLSSITIPDSVFSIGSLAFDDTAYYNELNNWENGALYINNHLVATSGEIANDYKIRNGTKTIGEQAFGGCNDIESIYIPNSVVSIGFHAFGYCSSLTNINIPDSIISIDNAAFNHCSSLKTITIPSSITSIRRGTFEFCEDLMNINMPDSITSIGEYAFKDCSSLTSVTIPDSVTSIGEYAFEDCSSLTSISIPNSTISIGYNTFYCCSSLSYVYYDGTEEELKSIEGYTQLPSKATIHYTEEYTDDTEISGESGAYNPTHEYSIVRYDDLLEGNCLYDITDNTDTSFKNHTSGDSTWYGRLVMCELKPYEQKPGEFTASLNPELVKVYPVTEHYGTVSRANDTSMIVDGKKYKVGNNLLAKNPGDISPWTGSMLIGKEICFCTYANRVVDVEYISEDKNNFETRIKEYDPQHNTITILYSSYSNSGKYYISKFGNITTDKVNEIGKGSVDFTYDGYGNIYNISKGPMLPEEGSYGIIKPSTWDEVKSAANDFVTASQEYQNGVNELIKKQPSEEEKKKNERRSGAQKLMESDNASKSKILSFGSINDDTVTVYAYEALYDALQEAQTAAEVNLGDVKVNGDTISVTTEIVKKLTKALSNVSFTRTYGKYEIKISMLSYMSARFGSMTMYDNGRTVDTITICSTTEDVQKAYEVYFAQLKELAENSIEGAASEVVKALSGKSINDWGKLGFTRVLKKYAPEIKLKGAGDVIEAVSAGHDIYKKIKKIISLKDASPEEQYEAVLKIDYFPYMKDDTSITDKTIDKLYDKLKSAASTLEAHINSYQNGTEPPKKEKKKWFFNIKCPVNVYVYDKTGNEVGYAISNDIEYNDDICIEKYGDIKQVQLPDINQYDIKIVATDSGKLNYTVEQFNDDGSPIGRANFYDIDLYEGKELTSSANITDITNENDAIILDSDGEQLAPSEYINASDSAEVLVCGQSENGDILGLGSYPKGECVNLTAVPNDNYHFTGWYIDDNLISTDITYSLCAASDVMVTAKFDKDITTEFVKYEKSTNGYNIKLNIKNNTDYEVSGILYTAIFNSDNVLQAVEKSEITTSANDITEANADLNYQLTSGDRVALYLWDDNMMPLANKIISNSLVVQEQ